MILSGTSIAHNIYTGNIEVEPEPDNVQYQPASLDVRLGEEIVDAQNGRHLKDDQHQLEPNRRYLASTKERISLPNDMAAQLTGRSTIGRRGIIIHKTAGWVDPGFEGTLTLEILNLGRLPKKVQPGDRIGQLVFFVLDKPSWGYDGKYQGQQGPTPPR